MNAASTTLDFFLDSSLSDAALSEQILQAPDLTHLTVSRCEHVTDKGFEALIGNCENVTHLNVSNSLISDAVLPRILRSLPRLESLNLSLCENLTDKSFNEIPHCPALSFLDLTGSRVTNDTLCNIAKGCTRLMHLHLGGCPNLSTPSLLSLPPQLLSLDVSASRLEQTDWPPLFQRCKNLTDLTLAYSTTASDETLKSLTSNCLHLTSVNASSCYQITEEALDALRARGITVINQDDL